MLWQHVFKFVVCTECLAGATDCIIYNRLSVNSLRLVQVDRNMQVEI